jgi:hypothetical protein
VPEIRESGQHNSRFQRKVNHQQRRYVRLSQIKWAGIIYFCLVARASGCGLAASRSLALRRVSVTERLVVWPTRVRSTGSLVSV